MRENRQERKTVWHYVIRAQRWAVVLLPAAATATPLLLSSQAGLVAVSATQQALGTGIVAQLAAVHAGANAVNAANAVGTSYGIYTAVSAAVAQGAGVVIVAVQEGARVIARVVTRTQTREDEGPIQMEPILAEDLAVQEEAVVNRVADDLVARAMADARAEMEEILKRGR